MALPNAACTVVIPCYNGQNDLASAVDSVLAQSFADFHVVLVDDGSTDGTLAAMEGLAANQPNITILHLTANVGRSRARNIGAEATLGPYLAFLDHDDTFHRDFLLHTSGVLNQAPHIDRVKVLPNVSIELDPIRYEAVKNSLVTTSLIRREAFNFIGGWPESEVFRRHEHAGEDIAFEELFRQCFDTGWLTAKLYNYMHRPGNSLDRFLARSSVEGSKLISTEAAAERDKLISQEIHRLKRALRKRIRGLAFEQGRQFGLQRLEP